MVTALSIHLLFNYFVTFKEIDTDHKWYKIYLFQFPQNIWTMIKCFWGCVKSKNYTNWRYMFFLQCNLSIDGSPQLPAIYSSDLVSSFCYFPSHCFPNPLHKIFKYTMQCNLLSRSPLVCPVSLKFSKTPFFHHVP